MSIKYESKGGSLLGTIMDFGRELIVAGEEIWRVEETINDICDAYAFKKYDVWVTSTCIEATVQTNDNRVYTQIRSIDGKSFNVDRLTHLEMLSDEVIRRRMGAAAFREKLNDILAMPGAPAYVKYIGSAIAVAGFTVFFDGDAADVAVAAFIALVMALISDTIGRKESNPLIYNSIAAFIMELMAAMSVYGGLGHYADIIASAALLLLISGLGITNGIKDLLHKNTLSGLNDILVSLLGAAGIAIGISLVLYFLKGSEIEPALSQSVVSNYFEQIASCTVGCMGFALLFGAKGKTLLLSGIGAAATWSVYLAVSSLMNGNYFAATLTGACFVGIYSNEVSRISGTPATVFLITVVFPLVPGSNLYRTVYALIMDDRVMQHSQSRQLLLICLAIALGYIIIEVLYKYLRMLKEKFFF